MSEYVLASPFVELTWDRRPERWALLCAVWFAGWIVAALILLYLYAVIFPSVVGFETALLVGIGLVIFGLGGDF